MSAKIVYRDQLRIPATLEELHTVYGWAEERLIAASVEESQRFDIMLALSEAVTNAIRHGSAQLPNAKVTIELEFTESSVTVKVSDSGSGFDPDHLPDPTEGQNVFIPNGRGVFLIKTLADEVHFNFSDDGTMVTVGFRKR